jgi:hypothetical protein
MASEDVRGAPRVHRAGRTRADGVAVRREHGDGGHRKLRIVHEQLRPEGRGPDDGTTIQSAPMRARSGREQQKLARRMDPGREVPELTSADIGRWVPGAGS